MNVIQKLLTIWIAPSAAAYSRYEVTSRDLVAYRMRLHTVMSSAPYLGGSTCWADKTGERWPTKHSATTYRVRDVVGTLLETVKWTERRVAALEELVDLL